MEMGAVRVKFAYPLGLTEDLALSAKVGGVFAPEPVPSRAPLVTSAPPIGLEPPLPIPLPLDFMMYGGDAGVDDRSNVMLLRSFKSKFSNFN